MYLFLFVTVAVVIKLGILLLSLSRVKRESEKKGFSLGFNVDDKIIIFFAKLSSKTHLSQFYVETFHEHLSRQTFPSQFKLK
jgi:hypothetical protein